jgi:hypothetical protein
MVPDVLWQGLQELAPIERVRKTLAFPTARVGPQIPHIPIIVNAVGRIEAVVVNPIRGAILAVDVVSNARPRIDTEAPSAEARAIGALIMRNIARIGS